MQAGARSTYEREGGRGPHRDDHGDQADGERNTPAIQRASQQVAAEVVGAERVLHSRRAHDVDEVEILGVDPVDQRANGHGDDKEQQHARADHGQGVAPETPPCVAGKRARLGRERAVVGRESDNVGAGDVEGRRRYGG